MLICSRGNEFICSESLDTNNRRSPNLKVNTKYLAGIFIIFFFLFGIAQWFVPVAEGQQSSLVVDRSYWLSLADNAWKYYQPGVAVDSTTGLHGSGLGYPYFTDWDLGVYIQAIIDVSKLGILNSGGAWGADERFIRY